MLLFVSFHNNNTYFRLECLSCDAVHVIWSRQCLAVYNCIFSIMIQVKYVADSEFLCHVQVSLRTFLNEYCHLLILPTDTAAVPWEARAGEWAASRSTIGSGVSIKVRPLDFLKGAEQAVLAGPAWQLTAHWQADKQKHTSFFPWFVPVPLVSPYVGENL